ncbi:MAG: 3D domain-containing protein [Lachnospirales bacterium]
MVKKIVGCVLAVILVVGISQTNIIFGSSAEDYNKVFVEYKDRTVEYNTKVATVGEFISDMDIQLVGTESVDLPPEKLIQNNLTIPINPGIKTTLSINDVENEITVIKGTTINDLIKELSVETGKDYYCVDPVDFENMTIEEGMEITLLVRTTASQITTVAIPFGITYEDTESIPEGEEKTITEGVQGIETIEEEVSYYNGQEHLRKVVSREITREPINQVVQRGVAKTVSTPSGKRVYSKMYRMSASAYTAGYESTGKNPGDPGYGVTATGTRASHGTVAVDPRVIPLGSTLYVEGYGICKATDVGGAIKGNKIDLFFHDLGAALNYGRRNVRVYVLK